MPAYDVYYESNTADIYTGESVASVKSLVKAGVRIVTVSYRLATSQAAANFPAPEGRHVFIQEAEVSRLLAKWRFEGDTPFAGREDDYDALMMSLDEDIADDAKAITTFLALADLADECGAFSQLVADTRRLCSKIQSRTAGV